MMKAAFLQITTLLQKFSPGELKTLIPFLFSEIGWEVVASSLRKNRLSCQSRYIAMTTSALYEESGPSKDSIQFIVWILQFYDKITHSNQEWHGIHLTDLMEEVTDTSNIEKNIISAYRRDARDAEVMLKIHDDLIFMMTIEKKTSPKGITYKKPFYFVYNHSLVEPYAFYTPNFFGCNDLTKYCCQGMGYDNFEDISLKGKDVNSLFDMIERDINSSRSLQVAKQYHPVTVVDNDDVVDFTLGKERAKYADEVLPGLTNLQKYTVQANNEWRGAPYLPELEGIKIHSAITITSSATNIGVEDILKEMIKRGMVHLPVPSYIANIPRLPKNTIKLDEDESQMNDSD